MNDHQPTRPGAPTQALGGATTPLPQAAAPYRVEPTAPVPDDTVRPDDGHTPDHRWGRAPAPTPLVTVSRGPRAGTVLLGLLALLVAAWALVGNLADVDLEPRTAGPVAIGGVGLLLLVVGLVGLVVSRRRR
ncbi:hypothetical protein [Terracoccus luteus]|jgi:hypothetical protein|uniref:Uncharacterized protein n=1 Tax=Terracoccus luteus TaxID=53356 RepID=A0A839PZ28_9MICO|nr:hypothetical protein [Terracoccus luteus]MBB2985651.1 hypothetical protein [Terracoccus luteus]MCP2171303.1 hypothetical protein [Terracoccus luteus]